jgi:hypothetical protein
MVENATMTQKRVFLEERTIRFLALAMQAEKQGWTSPT